MNPTLVLDRFDDPAVATEAAADEIAAILSQRIVEAGRASFVATGGGTPAPVYAALSRRTVAWNKVTVTLSDERWVEADSPLSNAALVQRTLLARLAPGPTFVGLKTSHATPAAAVAAVEARLAQLGDLDLVMLGMGGDGHVASLFPANAALAEGLDLGARRRCVAVPVGPGDQAPLEPRMSLSLSAIVSAGRVLIYMAGAEKWAVLQRALAGDDVAEMPVRGVLNRAGAVRVICAG